MKKSIFFFALLFIISSAYHRDAAGSMDLTFDEVALPGEQPAEMAVKKRAVNVRDFKAGGARFSRPDAGGTLADCLAAGLAATGRYVISRNEATDADSLTGTVSQEQGCFEIGLTHKLRAKVNGHNDTPVGCTVSLEEIIPVLVFKAAQLMPLTLPVAKREGDRVIVKKGSAGGIYPGATFTVSAPSGRPIRHPKTGEILDIPVKDVGEIIIMAVGKETAQGLIRKEEAPGAVRAGGIATEEPFWPGNADIMYFHGQGEVREPVLPVPDSLKMGLPKGCAVTVGELVVPLNDAQGPEQAGLGADDFLLFYEVFIGGYGKNGSFKMEISSREKTVALDRADDKLLRVKAGHYRMPIDSTTLARLKAFLDSPAFRGLCPRRTAEDGDAVRVYRYFTKDVSLEKAFAHRGNSDAAKRVEPLSAELERIFREVLKHPAADTGETGR